MQTKQTENVGKWNKGIKDCGRKNKKGTKFKIGNTKES